MDARNRLLPDWFARIRTGQVLLPRFQRHQAWSADEVGSLLEAVLSGLPAGAALVLEVGDSEPFVSRPMAGAPTPTERCTEHLLDGQQRLTALWRSLHDDYTDRTWCIGSEPDPEHGGEKPVAVGVPRWNRGGRRFPLWVDDPRQLWARGLIPARLLTPSDVQGAIDTWTHAATTGDLAAILELQTRINRLRTLVREYNVPYLSLPTTTARDVALDVFIKLNTTSVPLTAFDIVVAQLEASTGESLHDLVEGVTSAVPRASEYRNVGSWVLDTGALRSGRPPTQASYLLLNDDLIADWSNIVAGLEWTVEFLEAEHVFDQLRLPTVAVLPVIAALRPSLPAHPDEEGAARQLLRAYLWRAFLTRRYERSVGSRSFQDFQGLKTVLEKKLDRDRWAEAIPIFNEEDYPLPSSESLVQARWPRYRDILGRGILAVALRAGARDISDDSFVNPTNIKKREYHHLFPDSILTGEDGKLSSETSYRALNCALITWRTNRVIGADDPVTYLRKRIESPGMDEATIRGRLETHLVPFAELRVGWGDVAGSVRGDRIRADYEAFLTARAEMLIRPIKELCAGRSPQLAWLL